MDARPLIVSIHDVAPSTLAEVRWLLDRLDAIGARPRVLKVIPDEAGRGDLRHQPELAALLRAEAATGSEIVLHGLTHRCRGRLLGPWPDRLRGRLFAAGAAEFLALDPAAMAERVEGGQAILAATGLTARGFCAPGWLAAPGLAGVLRRHGFRHLLWRTSIEDLERRRRLRAPSGGYMGSGPAQEQLEAIGSALAAAAARGSPRRIFLHPQGAPSSSRCRAALRSVEAALADARPSTYLEFLDASA